MVAAVAISDVIVPSIFTPYMQQLTEEKSRLIQSGAVTRDSELDSFLAGGGLTVNSPSFKDLADDADNVSDDSDDDSTANKMGTSKEIQVRLSRNSSWATKDLAGDLAGADPMQAIASRVAAYWVRRSQVMFVATMKGIFVNNAASTDSYHVQNDMTFDVSSSGFVDGVTNFTSEAFIDATATIGDSMQSLGLMTVHSIVYARMQKNNLIDFIPDSDGKINIPTFLGRIVIVDDGMPNSGGVFESWLFGAGAMRLGMGSPKVPTETIRKPSSGNGGGMETLFSRTEWCLHAVGHAYIGTPDSGGGPTNAATSNNLGAAGSWRRVFPERKQIKIARLITREY